MLFAANFLVLFGPRLRVADLHSLAVVFFACYAVHLLLARKSELSETLTLAQFPLLFYSSLVAVVSNSMDFTITWIVVKWILYLLAGHALVSLYRGAGGDWQRNLLRHCVVSGAINAAFVVLVVVYAPARVLSSTLLDLQQKDSWIELGFRGFDLSMGGGASGSIAFAVLFAASMAGMKAFRHGSASIICSVLLFFGTLLTGRTGMVIIALSLVAFPLLSRFREAGNARSWRSFALPSVVVACVVGVGIYIFASTDETATHLRDTVLPWALEGLMSDSGGATGNRSVDTILQDMLFVPDSDISVLLGTGNSGRSELLAYIPSDVGYVRLIYSVGLVGIAFAVIGYTRIFSSAWRLRRYSDFAPLTLFYLGVIVAANAKELYLAPRGGAALLAIWAATLVHERRVPNERFVQLRTTTVSQA